MQANQIIRPIRDALQEPEAGKKVAEAVNIR